MIMTDRYADSRRAYIAYTLAVTRPAKKTSVEMFTTAE
jgi:hypothetical protein